MFVTPAGDFLPAAQVCGPRAGAEPALLRVTTLVHEAIHWVVVTPGHEELGEIRDPFNFEFYMLESRCQVPATIVDSYRAPAGV